MLRVIHYLSVLLVIVSLFACTNNNNGIVEEDKEIVENIKPKKKPVSSEHIYQFDNTLFSVPSPYETSSLLKELNINYNSKLINPIENIPKYVGNFKKSLNLGVYGVDLAYLNLNKQMPEATKYFMAIKLMAEDLNLSGVFDSNVIQRVEDNLGNEDSLLYILSKTYKKADKYMKDNERYNTGVLIVTGGWIESLYFLSQIYAETQNENLLRRLGDQKYPLENLIKCLTPFYNESEMYTDLLESLIDLSYVYDAIDVDYTYVEPTLDVEKKTITINSKSKLKITKEDTEEIYKKITTIRSQIID